MSGVKIEKSFACDGASREKQAGRTLALHQFINALRHADIELARSL